MKQGRKAVAKETLGFEQLWQASQFRLSDLRPETVQAFSEPPLRWLGEDVAGARLARIAAVEFSQLFGLLAVVTVCRAADSMLALELLGVIEAEDADGEADEPIDAEPLSPPPVAAFPAPPPPEPEPGPEAPAPLTLPAAAAQAPEPEPEPTPEPEPEQPGPQGYRQCPTCGVFFQRNRRQIYCSDRCRPSRQPLVHTKSCEVCAAEFETTYNRQRFCSDQCRDHSRYSRLKAERATRSIERPPTAKSCQICGSAFAVRPSSGGQRKYCSQECGRAAIRRRNGWAQLDKVTRRCVVCGDDYQPVKGAQVTCSVPCRAVYKHGDLERIAALIEQFRPPQRWRWLLRQIEQIGVEGVALEAGLSLHQTAAALAVIRSRQATDPAD